MKFSDATWLPDSSSYLYQHFPVTGDAVGTESAALPTGRLMRHHVGESQDTDELVLELPDDLWGGDVALLAGEHLRVWLAKLPPVAPPVVM